MKSLNIFFYVGLTIVAALVLSILPLPIFMSEIWPACLLVVVVYWIMALPQSIGLWTAWLCGLSLDVLQDTLLGEHALGFLFVAILVRLFYRQLRMYSRLQQSIIIFVIILGFQSLMAFINALAGRGPQVFLFWLVPFSSMLLWPLLFVILRDYRRRFVISSK